MNNALRKAWLPKFLVIGKVDGGHALRTVLQAYDLDNRGSPMDILDAIISVGGMTTVNQLDKTYETFTLYGAALSAAYPQGDALYLIVIASGVPPDEAHQQVLRFCRTHPSIRAPGAVY